MQKLNPWTIVGWGCVAILVVPAALFLVGLLVPDRSAVPTQTYSAPVKHVAAPEPTPPPEPAPPPPPPPEPPAPVTALAAPLQFSGTGNYATEVFTLQPGMIRAEFQHNGSSNFGVTLLDGAGEFAALFCSEIGPVNGSQVDHIDAAGSYLLNISADGAWTVTLK